MEKTAFTVREAAEIIGVSRSQIYNIFANGDIVPRKLGSRTLIMRADLNEFMRKLPSGGRYAR